MLFTALIMGIAGSLHCAGMCSPLAMTVTGIKSSFLVNRLLYNFGRITTYGILGAIAASIGYLLPFTGFQNVLSVTLGLLLLIMASAGITGLRIPYITRGIIRFSNLLKTLFGKFLQHKTPATYLVLGGLNGLLPCGLTFLALTLCLTLSTPFDGFVYMFSFGIGTMPVMLGFVSVMRIITEKLHWKIASVTTGLMIISGMLLIARVFLFHAPDAHQHASVVDIVICR